MANFASRLPSSIAVIARSPVASSKTLRGALALAAYPVHALKHIGRIGVRSGCTGRMCRT
jgi:hypothetical protein